MSAEKENSASLRRRALWLGVAAGAALAGIAVARWRLREGPVNEEAETAFWGLQFEGLTGEPVRMEAFRGAPLLVNFWATWCPPCVEEMPLLDAFFHQNSSKGWKVLGLAVDKPQNVQSFLQKSPVGFSIALAGSSGTNLSKSLGNLAGGLPYTVVFGRDGRVAQRKMGQVSVADLAAWAQIR